MIKVLVINHRYLMKKLIISFVLTLSLFGFMALNIGQVNAAVHVNGYFKSNGTYVAPHYRSNPDGNPYNNWSFPGNTNPYTGKTATGNADTYLNNYYKNSSSSYSNSSSSYDSLFNSLYTPTVIPTKDIPYVVKLWVDNNPYSDCSQSSFLRNKEKIECDFYKKNEYSYKWNTTTNEYDGTHYSYSPETGITTSCPDNFVIRYSTLTGKPESCIAGK